jgi:hypothetical protein
MPDVLLCVLDRLALCVMVDCVVYDVGAPSEFVVVITCVTVMACCSLDVVAGAVVLDGGELVLCAAAEVDGAADEVETGADDMSDVAAAEEEGVVELGAAAEVESRVGAALEDAAVLPEPPRVAPRPTLSGVVAFCLCCISRASTSGSFGNSSIALAADT